MGKNRLSTIIEIICAIVHDSRALSVYTVICTAKFLYSNVQESGKPDNPALEGSSPRIKSFAFLLEKNFVSGTGRSSEACSK